MSLMSRLVGRMYDLPPRRNAVKATRDMRVPAADGVPLLTDLYAPRKRGSHPTLLIRLPYGRGRLAAMGEAYAERGYNTLMQACRGTDGSGGEFDPLVYERDDGLATLAWLREQPWFDGRLGLTGPSYMGFAQWAICDALPENAVMSTKVTSAEFHSVLFPGGTFHLGLLLSWMQTIEGLSGGNLRFMGEVMTGNIERTTKKAAAHLPVIEADRIAMGHEIAFWRRWFAKAFDNPPFWRALDHTRRLGPKTPPNHFVSGWYDFMIDQLLRDYHTLVAAGQMPYLTIGPWTHVANELQAESMRQTLSWMDAHFGLGRTPLRPHPVRIHVTGTDRWHDLDSFPPPGATEVTYHLRAAGHLSAKPAPASAPDRYPYDPAHPTPSIGGAMFAFTGAGPVDNAELEKRDDVLVYTSAPLDRSLTIIGNVKVALFARSSLDFADFFVRLNDVDPDGRSINITDAITRVSAKESTPDADGVWHLSLSLHATAHCFRAGHRLRILAASGAHPRFARNTGTAEPLATATTLVAATQEVFHDPERPSTVTLPVHAL